MGDFKSTCWTSLLNTIIKTPNEEMLGFFFKKKNCAPSLQTLTEAQGPSILYVSCSASRLYSVAFVQTGAHSSEQEVNMEKLCSTVCLLIFAFGALLHFDTVFAREAKGNLTVKPGVCPRRLWGVGTCAEFCSDDSDCPNDEKCCSNGCGHDCMAPYTVKKGRCPLPPSTPMCAEYCNHDGQCPGEQKCCRTTCGHACSEPC